MVVGVVVEDLVVVRAVGEWAWWVKLISMTMMIALVNVHGDSPSLAMAWPTGLTQ